MSDFMILTVPSDEFLYYSADETRTMEDKT